MLLTNSTRIVQRCLARGTSGQCVFLANLAYLALANLAYLAYLANFALAYLCVLLTNNTRIVQRCLARGTSGQRVCLAYLAYLACLALAILAYLIYLGTLRYP